MLVSVSKDWDGDHLLAVGAQAECKEWLYDMGRGVC